MAGRINNHTASGKTESLTPKSSIVLAYWVCPPCSVTDASGGLVTFTAWILIDCREKFCTASSETVPVALADHNCGSKTSANEKWRAPKSMRTLGRPSPKTGTPGTTKWKKGSIVQNRQQETRWPRKEQQEKSVPHQHAHHLPSFVSRATKTAIPG